MRFRHVELRLNDLVLRNAPARVARGRQRLETSCAARLWSRRRRFSRGWRAPSCPIPTRCCGGWGSNPDLGAAAAIWTLQFARYSAQNLFGRSIRQAFPKFRGCC